jgi:uncharacterized protein
MKPPTITLGKDHAGHNVEMDIDTLIKTRLLIQANSGGGKSFLIRRMCEQLFGHVPVIIIDPEGEFATLREKFGYVLVGKGGETPADPRSAKLVAHKLLELRASAVVDLYEMNPSQRHLYVRLFSEAMIDAPKNLWRPTIMVFDEAHTFAPEKGAGESEASDAVTAFPTRGRKRRFCAVFATQRLGKLRKDASAELLNRLVGPTFEDVDLKRAADLLSIPGDQRRAFDAEMRVLDPGNFYALGRAICKERTLFKVGSVQTSHEIEESKYGSEPPPTPEKIKGLLPQLADLPKQAENAAKTEAELKAENRTLKLEIQQLKAAKPQAAVTKAEIKEVSILTEKDREDIAHAANCVEGNLNSIRSDMIDFTNSSRKYVEELKGLVSKISAQSQRAPNSQRNHISTPYQSRARVLRPPVPTFLPQSNGDLKLGGPELKLLSALKLYPEGVSKTKLALLTRYAHNGGAFNNPLGRLRSMGLVEGGSDCIRITDAGNGLIPHVEPLPTGEALVQHWLDDLAGPEAVIFKALLEHGEAPNKEELAARCVNSQGQPYEPNGGAFNNPLGRLRTLGLITKGWPCRLSDDFL